MFLQWLARAKDNITIPGESGIIRTIESGYSNYLVAFSQLTDLRNKERSPFVVENNEYHSVIYPLFTKVRDACIQLRNLNEETMYAASVRANYVAQRAIWSTVVVAASSLSVALIFSLILSERIARPLRRFTVASRQIAGGDYTVQVPTETTDELGLLAKEFNRMATQLSQYHEMNIGKIIAEKQKSETILNSIEDGLIVFNTDHQVTDINPAACRMLGLGFENCLYKACQAIMPDQHVCDLVKETAEKGSPPGISEDDRFITIRQGENPRHFFFAISVIGGKIGVLSGVVLLLRDVTRLKEVERLKSEFVMAASHELRTPLMSMGMSIDLLMEHAAKGLSSKDRELLQAAHEEVHRLKALVADLLDLSKIEAGKIELEFDNVPPHALVERVETVFKSQLREKAVRLTAGLPDGLPAVRADLNKITWVLTNLVSNALRYVQKDGHIDIAVERVGGHLHLSVQDDGRGIPAEYQARIFQKFVQIKGQEDGGTGLGLAICKEIVRAHGGAIWVESVPGKGSKFTFTLPVAG